MLRGHKWPLQWSTPELVTKYSDGSRLVLIVAPRAMAHLATLDRMAGRRRERIRPDSVAATGIEGRHATVFRDAGESGSLSASSWSPRR